MRDVANSIITSPSTLAGSTVPLLNSCSGNDDDAKRDSPAATRYSDYSSDNFHKELKLRLLDELENQTAANSSSPSRSNTNKG